ncbi:MAG: hypothetical protein AVDCRST_MAG93-2905 [uncultured Chloroflexia bacterium]|uniref:Uncharacterized protein n=1 Tax=uncultured Chloroflexia bacterium TaxID=1672391 RepID=A0A6J4JGN6_9CHLR|nr:MAG: hypothetical protein AVDCRST_MAG93-2905 [uncultured Chloroflexia bacterium]
MMNDFFGWESDIHWRQAAVLDGRQSWAKHMFRSIKGRLLLPTVDK